MLGLLVMRYIFSLSPFALSPVLHLNGNTKVKEYMLEGIICDGCLGRNGIEQKHQKIEL